MALYVTRPRRDEVRIGRGLPSASKHVLVHDGSVGNLGPMSKVLFIV